MILNGEHAVGIALLASLFVAGCHGVNGIAPDGEGSGFVQSTNCLRGDLDFIEVKKVSASNGISFAGPGVVGCQLDTDPFGVSATASYSSDDRQLPEWIDFEIVSFERRKYSSEEYNRKLEQPGEVFRVYVREQIPRHIVQEAQTASKQARPDGLPGIQLHLFFNFMRDGIKLTWATQYPGHWAPVKYGGFVPKNLDVRTAQLLQEGHSQFVSASQ